MLPFPMLYLDCLGSADVPIIHLYIPTVQPLRVVQPDAVCEVGGSTPGLSHGDLGIFLGGGQTEEFVH